MGFLVKSLCLGVFFGLEIGHKLLFSNFLGAAQNLPDIPAIIRGYPANKFVFPWCRGTCQTCWSPRVPSLSCMANWGLRSLSSLPRNQPCSAFSALFLGGLKRPINFRELRTLFSPYNIQKRPEPQICPKFVPVIIFWGVPIRGTEICQNLKKKKKNKKKR